MKSGLVCLLLSFSMRFPKFIHILACMSTSLHLMAVKYKITSILPFYSFKNIHFNAIYSICKVCSYHHYVVSELFINPNGSPVTIKQSLPFSFFLSLRQLLINFLSLGISLFQIFHINEILQYVIFWCLVLSLSMFSRFLHVLAYTSLPFMAEKYSIEWVNHIVLIHSSNNGHLGSFHLWPL